MPKLQASLMTQSRGVKGTIGFAPADGVGSAAGAGFDPSGRQLICIPDGETTYQGAPNASIPWPLTWPTWMSAMK